MLNDIKIHGYLGRDPELKEYKNAKGEIYSTVRLYTNSRIRQL